MIKKLLKQTTLAGLSGLAGLVAFTVYESRRVEKLVPRVGRLLEVDGLTVHVSDTGQGEPVVFLHGLGGQLRHFHALTGRLSERFRVISIDRPGSGYSQAPERHRCGLFEQARLMAEVMQVMDLKRPVLVGHSLGGAVALSVCLLNPELCRGLALVAPLTHPMESLPEAFKGLTVEPALLRQFLAWTLISPMARWGPKDLLEQVFHPDPIPSDFGNAAGGWLGRRPKSYLSTCEELRAIPKDLEELRRRYHEIDVPVRMLFGESDTILDPAVQGEPMNGLLSDFRLTTVSGGHMLPLTHPEMTGNWLLDTMGEL